VKPFNPVENLCHLEFKRGTVSCVRRKESAGLVRQQSESSNVGHIEEASHE